MCLQPILWDYQLDPYEFYETAMGYRERVGARTRLAQNAGTRELV